MLATAVEVEDLVALAARDGARTLESSSSIIQTNSSIAREAITGDGRSTRSQWRSGILHRRKDVCKARRRYAGAERSASNGDEGAKGLGFSL